MDYQPLAFAHGNPLVRTVFKKPNLLIYLILKENSLVFALIVSSKRMKKINSCNTCKTSEVALILCGVVDTDSWSI